MITATFYFCSTIWGHSCFRSFIFSCCIDPSKAQLKSIIIFTRNRLTSAFVMPSATISAFTAGKLPSATAVKALMVAEDMMKELVDKQRLFLRIIWTRRRGAGHAAVGELRRGAAVHAPPPASPMCAWLYMSRSDYMSASSACWQRRRLTRRTVSRLLACSPSWTALAPRQWVRGLAQSRLKTI